MRRDANRLLESTAEMVRAQIDELCQRSERYGLRQVLFDVSRNDTLLPRSKPAPRQPPRAPRIATSAKEFARNHDCKRFTIALVLGAILDGSGQLDRGLPQHGIFEEQQGRKTHSARPAVGIDHLGGIEIEADDPTANTGALPLTIFVTSGHERELASERA